MKTPTLTNTYTGKDGVAYVFEYFESDSFDHLEPEKIKQVYGFSFAGDNLIVVNNVHNPNSFTPPGGGVEEGEHPDNALARELQEEANMKVLAFKPVGYQKVTDTSGIIEPYYQLRYACVVEPYGPFIEDPDGDVTEIFEVHPDEYKKYFDWGEIGDAIVKRAVTLKENM